MIIFEYVLLCILLFVQSGLSSIFSEKDEFQRTNISTLKRLISYYKDYIFVLHYDLQMEIDIAVIIQILPPFQLISVDNHFHNSTHKNSVNIFFIHNSSDFNSYRHNLKAFNQDGCNLFIAFKVFEEICSIDIVDLAPASFIYNINRNELYSCFTKKEDSSITPVREYQFDVLKIFHRTYGDLRGETLKLFFLPNAEIICINDDRSGKLNIEHDGSCNPVGPEADLVKVLGKKLNFTPEFRPFDVKVNYLTWKQMLNAISRGEAEFAVGSIFLSEDGPVYYTSFICSSAIYGIYFVNPTKQFNLGMILESFDLNVYVISISTLILILTEIAAFTYFFNYNFWEKKFILTMVKIVTEQGSNLNNRFHSFNTIRFNIFLWLFFNIIFCTALKSRISSVLTKPPVYDFRSVNDLVANDYVFTIADRFEKMFHEKYSQQTFKRRSLTQDYLKDICLQAETFFEGRFVLIHGEHNIVSWIQLCNRFFPLDKLKDQRFLMESKNYHAFALSSSSPHRKQFTLIIDNLKASGIMYYWYQYMSIESLGKYKEHFLPKPLRIQQIYNFFVLLIVGLGIGFIVFILEIIEAALIRRGKITVTILEKL